MMLLIAALALFIVISLVAYVLFAPPSREDEETEWMVFGTILFGEMDGED